MKLRLKSITYAMKVKEILENSGISAAVVKDIRRSGGCGYAISFPDQYLDTVLQKIKENGIALHPSEKWE